MAIRQRIKRKVKNVLKSIIDRLVDADTESYQESTASTTASNTPETHEPPADSPTSQDDGAREETAALDTSTATTDASESEVSKGDVPQPLKEVAVSSQLSDVTDTDASAEPEHTEPTSSKDEEPKEQTEEEKKADAAAKHWEKTRKGLLKKLKKEGGKMGLAELHDFSERRFFIGHQKFSMIMEELVEEELVLYSLEDYTVTLGDKAEDYLKS
ncbi:MAG: hypothetical protein VX278_14275 [Myxococcota bacterium]|nr:hypothetical protein [Myxococcota bacterium]